MMALSCLRQYGNHEGSILAAVCDEDMMRKTQSEAVSHQSTPGG